MSNSKEKLRIVCFGYNGVNNTGSEAKLLTTLKTIKAVIGDRAGELTVLTFNRENQERYLRDYPNARMVEISPWIPIQSPGLFFAGRYDLLLLSEGSTFIDHFSSMFLRMFCGAALWAKCRGTKVVAYANDCGHLRPVNQRLLRHTLNRIDLIMLRNSDAAARMREYGVTRDIFVTADGAYEYPLPSEEYRQRLFQRLGLTPGRRPLIGIAPKEFFWWPVAFRPWGHKEDLYVYPFYHTWAKGSQESSARYVAQSARHADWCVETYDADIVLISMEHMDYAPTQRIHDAMKHRDRAIIVSSHEYVVDDIVSVLSVLTALITTRYHAVVLSSASAIPMIAVSSDTRCEAVFRELGCMDRYIDYVKHPDPAPSVLHLDERLIEMTRSLFSTLGETRAHLAALHPQFVARHRQNQEIFSRWFAENFPRP